MIEIYKKTIKDLKSVKIENIEKGSWISVIDPGKNELEHLIKQMSLDSTILEDGLDENEISRIKIEDNIFYLIIRFPMEDSGSIITLPLLILVTEENILTLCKKDNNIVSKFAENKIPFCTTQKTQLLLKIILEIFNSYDFHLNRILKDIKLKKIKISNLNNNDILFLVQEEETLNDFVSSLAPNINILEKILSGRYIEIYEKDRDIIEDLFMDSKQTLEISRVGLRSIKNIREAYSAILTNELNKVIKLLTAVTIVLTIPTIVSSIFGMNVKLPFESSPFAFFYVLVIIIVLTSLLFYILIKRRWV